MAPLRGCPSSSRDTFFAASHATRPGASRFVPLSLRIKGRVTGRLAEGHRPRRCLKCPARRLGAINPTLVEVRDGGIPPPIEKMWRVRVGRGRGIAAATREAMTTRTFRLEGLVAPAAGETHHRRWAPVALRARTGSALPRAECTEIRSRLTGELMAIADRPRSLLLSCRPQRRRRSLGAHPAANHLQRASAVTTVRPGRMELRRIDAATVAAAETTSTATMPVLRVT
jgi:hypothetical protein